MLTPPTMHEDVDRPVGHVYNRTAGHEFILDRGKIRASLWKRNVSETSASQTFRSQLEL